MRPSPAQRQQDCRRPPATDSCNRGDRMSMERLSQQVDAYVTWKRELMREITRYRSWLAHNRLGSAAMDARLERALKLLRTDHITLAFVGEFSRGKTEL